MPSIYAQGRDHKQWYLFARTQLPLLLCTLVVVVLGIVASAALLDDGVLWGGLALIAVASVVAVTVPWDRFGPEWLLSVAIVDLLAVAMIRSSLIHIITPVGLLSVFPVMWIVYGFRRRFVPVAVVGAFCISGFPYLLSGRLPVGVEWAAVVTLPIIVVGIAFAASAAGDQLQRANEVAVKNAADLTVMLKRAQDSELLSRAIIDTVSAAVAFYGPDNRLVVANQIAHETVRTVGFELDEPPYAGPDVLQADRQTPIPFEDQIIPRALRGELLADHMEWLGKPGNQTAILATSRRVYRDNDELLGTVIVAYDVTKLAEAISVREAFLTTVSHELRTPLTSIVGYLELVEEGIDDADPDMIAYLSVINRNAQELHSRIAELLAVSDTHIVIEKSRITVAPVIGGIVEKLAPTAREKRLHFGAELDDALEASVDPDRLAQVMQNLVSNAIKYTPAGGRVDVGLVQSFDQLRITVVDTGIGMTDSERRQAFDRFYRAEAARIGAVQGIGLGLAIAKEIVEAHDGSIGIDSSSAGTTVTVLMPLR
ncbi:cell wall metabolism sensor histidine kinase WalK [Glaciihabitans sp. dw_435]|uniref:sensor histidine kinase n=1 Tax=Glaciihabitans sp. dw_435 TaxID=2720081 RepID=UPI001BD5DE41|nr:HAMP domain-containing sensor histidine kinase [Glaciihabitans sp. dw_435]